MDTKLKNNHNRNKIIIITLVLCLVAAVLYTARFPYFKSASAQYYHNPLESEGFVGNLYKGAFLLYQDLYEKVNQEKVSFEDLYMEAQIVQEKKISSTDSYTFLYSDGRYSLEIEEDGYPLEEEGIQVGEPPYELSQEEAAKQFSASIMKQAEAQFADSFTGLERVFEYNIVDNKTGTSITNSALDFTKENFRYMVKLTYDEHGNLGDIDVVTDNEADFRKTVAEVGRNNGGFKTYDFSDLEEKTGIRFRLLSPKDCTIYFGLTEEGYKNAQESVFYRYYGSWWDKYNAYDNTGITGWLLTFFAGILFVCFLFPIHEKLWETKLFRLPFEIVFVVFCITLGMASGGGEYSFQLVNFCEGNTAENFRAFTGNAKAAGMLAYAWNVFIVFVLFAVTAYITLCFREIRETGIRGYLRKRSYIYRFFPYIKRKIKKLYQCLTDIDISKGTNKVIIWLLVINGILVSFFTLFWFGGIFAVIIYSVILYFIMRKYAGDMKKKYDILFQATNQIAEGNLNVTITEKLGMFEPFRIQIERIQEGFKNAVEEEVKSQRMKTELITNVSHDLKTPLTAIITYINLLKEEDITEEQRKEYLDTLERKSLRLKVLIEDLFEVSKATSKNVSLNPVDVDIVDLLKQVNFELEEKLNAMNLEVRFRSSEEKAVLKLDSQKTYRVYENLMGNVAKYALPGTRVYVDIERRENRVVVEIKNISATEIDIAPEELTERFVRGDASRNTEGSGLGLAIAKSFVELQGGRMEIHLDGDLFKVITEWFV